MAAHRGGSGAAMAGRCGAVGTAPAVVVDTYRNAGAHSFEKLSNRQSSSQNQLKVTVSPESVICRTTERSNSFSNRQVNMRVGRRAFTCESSRSLS